MMHLRAAARSLGWVAAEFVPWQLIRVLRSRDLDARITRAQAAFDAFEEDHEVYEAPRPTLPSLMAAFWNAQTPEVEKQALEDLDRFYPDRYYPQFKSSAVAAAAGTAASPTTPPVGDNSEAGSVPPGPASQPIVNNITLNAPWPESPKPRWRAAYVYEETPSDGLRLKPLPGAMVDSDDKIVGRFESTVMAEKVVDMLNDYDRLKRQDRTTP